MPRATTRTALAEQLLQDVASRELAAPSIVTNDPDFTPVRCWTAGPGTPQEKLVVPGTVHGVKPDGTGAYILRSQDMVDLAKRAFGGKYYPDDIPADADGLLCDQCGWTTRSWKAFMKHVNEVHARPQGAVYR